jgi:putative inorganic carbon (HCO3(-)) transporter
LIWIGRLTNARRVRTGTGVVTGASLGYVVLLAALLAVGLALTLLPLSWLLVAVPGLTLVGIIVIRPQVALYLLCFAIPFGSLFEIDASRIAGGGITVGVTEGLIGLAFAAWLARTMAWRTPYTWPRLAVPLLLFVGATGLSLLNAPSLPLALKELAKWVEFLAVMLIVANVDDHRTSSRIVACLLLAGIGQAILGAYQFLARSGPEFFAVGRYIRAYGTFEQPNPYGGYLGLVAPLALALALYAFRRTEAAAPRRGGIPGWLKWLALGSFVAASAGIGMSASRGAWLAFGAAFVTVTVASSRKGAAILLALLLLVIGILGGFRADLAHSWLPAGIAQRLTSFLPFVGAGDVRSIEITDANYASLERLAFWQAALDMWRDHLWLGVGFGNYPIAFARYALPKWRMALGHAHNYYLNIAAETGLIGLLAYLTLWGAAIWQTARAMRRSRDLYAKALALGALGVLVHTSVHNIVDNLWVHNMYIHIAIVLGLAHARWNPNEKTV